ncbi:MAG: heavy metal-associated domain-containing protein [Tepidisphaeraceae bacterium]|jgi:P-type Cu+ transporter
MAHKPAQDRLVLIRIDGMHCHQCEQSVSKAISAKPGVHEVEVDFNTHQASVLFDPAAVKIAELMAAVNDAGYKAVCFTRTTPKSKS